MEQTFEFMKKWTKSLSFFFEKIDEKFEFLKNWTKSLSSKKWSKRLSL